MKTMQCVFSVGAMMAMWLAASPAGAQTAAIVRVARPGVVLETPRGDSVPVVRVAAGDELEVLDRRDDWLLVGPVPAAAAKAGWERGWIHVSAVDASGLPAAADEPPRPRGRLMIRGFGQTGGTLFTAEDSFDTIVGNPFGLIVGGGGQVVLPNGVFAQVSLDRFRETGSRVLVSGTQIFTLDAPVRVTVTPVLFSVGYRPPTTARYAPYAGGGLGWHSLEEESPSSAGFDPVDEQKIGYHVFGGVEVPLGRWLAVGGEVQWATVPDALGETGVSAAFGEDDLGGTTFRVKFIVGY